MIFHLAKILVAEGSDSIVFENSFKIEIKTIGKIKKEKNSIRKLEISTNLKWKSVDQVWAKNREQYSVIKHKLTQLKVS